MHYQHNHTFQNVSVAIVGDYALVLESYRCFFQKTGFQTVETFRTAAELIEGIDAEIFDVYIIHGDLPGMETVDLIGNIRELQPNARIIVNTMHDEIWIKRQMTDKNVNALLVKSDDFNQMIQAITAVMNGEHFYSEGLENELEQDKQQNDHPSQREIDILKAMAKGYTSKEIAALMFISENTVEAHRKSLFFKLGARNVADLIYKAIEKGYISVKK